MKSSKLIDKLNNRLFILFPFILMFGFASFMFILCNVSLIVSGGNIYDLLGGDVIPFKLGLSIPIFIILTIYYLKLTSILNRIEERS